MTFVHAALPVGNGRIPLSSNRLSANLVEMLGRKDQLFKYPKDKFNMCCARAIAVGMAQLDRELPGTRRKKTPWRERVRRYTTLQVKLGERVIG